VFGAKGFRSRGEKSRLSRKLRSTKEKSAVEGPMDLDIDLIKEKLENRLGPEIGPTVGPGVTIAAIRGTLQGTRVPVDLEAEEVRPSRFGTWV
jgi:hypothetical protein